eukprot:13384350-Ditylum_brightwellii.AAC.1
MLTNSNNAGALSEHTDDATMFSMKERDIVGGSDSEDDMDAKDSDDEDQMKEVCYHPKQEKKKQQATAVATKAKEKKQEKSRCISDERNQCK